MTKIFHSFPFQMFDRHSCKLVSPCEGRKFSLVFVKYLSTNTNNLLERYTSMTLSSHLRQRGQVKDNIQTNHCLGINNRLNKLQILVFSG